MTGQLGPLSYRLQPWQEEALVAWRNSATAERGPRHGVAEVFTGAGKTVFAMACMSDAQEHCPELRFAVVVPTQAIARQWQKSLCRGFGVPEKDIGLRMAGRRGALSTHRIVIYVLNSARKYLEADARGRDVMLIVDECHRAGSRDSLQIFRAETRYRLGLSATAGRDDMFDDAGNPIPAEDQPHIQAIGPICFRLDIRKARSLGLLPRYVIHHHRLPMTPAEEQRYETLCRDVQDCKDDLQRLGVSPEAWHLYCTRPPPRASKAQIASAQALQAAVFRRKQWLYGVSSRNRVARVILLDAAERFAKGGERLRALAFNERIDPWQDPDIAAEKGSEVGADYEQDEDVVESATTEEQDDPSESVPAGGAAALWDSLRSDARAGILQIPGGEAGVAIYHSRLGRAERERTLHEFGQGTTSVLVSVKALIEGLDVPDANLGLSVASTSSGRQRIQTMGRILRAPRDAEGNPLSAERQAGMPPKEIHLLYVGDTVDEEIYIRSNWSDLTGEAENNWWRWELDDQTPTKCADSNPPKPPPTEEESWSMLEGQPLPAAWAGSARGSQWTYRQDSVFSLTGSEATAPRDAITILEAASAGLADCRGRFVVTPRLSIILKKDAESGIWLAVGRLASPLHAKPADPRVSRSSDDTEAADTAEKDTPPAWKTAFAQALADIAASGSIGDGARGQLLNDVRTPEPVRAAVGAFDAATPATRAPKGLLSKALLTEILVALRSKSADRVAECAAALGARNDEWAPIAADAIEGIIPALRAEP